MATVIKPDPKKMKECYIPHFISSVAWLVSIMKPLKPFTVLRFRPVNNQSANSPLTFIFFDLLYEVEK